MALTKGPPSKRRNHFFSSYRPFKQAISLLLLWLNNWLHREQIKSNWLFYRFHLTLSRSLCKLLWELHYLLALHLKDSALEYFVWKAGCLLNPSQIEKEAKPHIPCWEEFDHTHLRRSHFVGHSADLPFALRCCSRPWSRLFAQAVHYRHHRPLHRPIILIHTHLCIDHHVALALNLISRKKVCFTSRHRTSLNHLLIRRDCRRVVVTEDASAFFEREMTMSFQCSRVDWLFCLPLLTLWLFSF